MYQCILCNPIYGILLRIKSIKKKELDRLYLQIPPSLIHVCKHFAKLQRSGLEMLEKLFTTK